SRLETRRPSSRCRKEGRLVSVNRPGRAVSLGRCRVRRSGDGPEPFQRRTVRTLPELLERPVADLPDPLPGHAEQHPDLFQRTLLALIQTVVQIEDLAFAFGEILLEHPLQEFATGLELHLFFDLVRLGSGEAFAERRRVPVAAVE